MWRSLWIAFALLILAGCGGGSSSTSTGPKRAAEPAEAPTLTAKPAGRTAPVGHEPEGLAWDAAAGRIAVGLREPAVLAFVDPRSLRVTDRVTLPAPPRHLGYAAESGTVLVPAEYADELVVARPSGIVSTTKVGNHPHDADALGPDVFVADEHSDGVSVVRDGRVVKTLDTPHQPGGIAVVDHRWVALVAVSARKIGVYDGRALKQVATLHCGVGPSHVVAGAGTTAYVADTQGEHVLVYRVDAHPKLLGEIAAPGTPYGLAFDAARHRLWVTETAKNEVVEYDTRGALPKRVAAYPTVRQPNSVAVDPRTGAVFVAGREDGQIQRIDPGRGES